MEKSAAMDDVEIEQHRRGIEEILTSDSDNEPVPTSVKQSAAAEDVEIEKHRRGMEQILISDIDNEPVSTLVKHSDNELVFAVAQSAVTDDVEIEQHRRGIEEILISDSDNEPVPTLVKHSDNKLVFAIAQSAATDDVKMGQLRPLVAESDNGSVSTSEKTTVTHPGTDVEDNHEAKIPMDLTLYMAAKQTDIHVFANELQKVAIEKSAVFDQASPIGNTYLHVAASFDNVQIARWIAHDSPPLITKKNFFGDTALHLTARAGYSSTTATLLKLWKDNADLPSAEGGDESQENLLQRLRNNKGNTPLHEALLNYYNQIACDLINADPEVAFYLNNSSESPLYLAAIAGYKDCVSLILSFSGEVEKMIDQKSVGKSPFHAAISSRNRDVLELMLEKAPKLAHFTDEEGRFPLHYAASLGYLEEVHYILDKFPSSANEWDKKGLLSIHWASIKGHVHIIKELLLRSPESTELLDRNGRNILHFAARSGKDKVAGYILKDRSFEGLINMKDKQGNTPLHLAAIHWHPKIVSALIWDTRVNLKAENNKGMTALDAATYFMDEETTFQQRFTWKVLKTGGVPRGRPRKIPAVKRHTLMARKTTRSPDYKDRVNTLLLVSTLVATVSFAAGFTMPGGYNNSDPYEGTATLLEQKKFHIFIFCDTIAMYSSIIVAVSLIWAQLGDLNLVLFALKLALPLLGIALAMMSLAFTAGVSVVISKLEWLDNAILIVGVIFLVILLALFFPLCIPVESHNRLLRYIFYYPFLLLIFVTNADPASVEG